MKPIRDWENIQAQGTSRSLPAGGYCLKINGARVDQSQNGNEMLVVAFDISKGEYEGFFKQKFDEDQRKEKKWPNGGIFRILIPQDSDDPDTFRRKAGRVKSFTNAVEESNPGYKWTWNEATLKGKAVGGMFGREEFETSDGRSAWSTKIRYACSVSKIEDGDYEIPADRPLKKRPETEFTPIDTDTDEDMPF